MSRTLLRISNTRRKSPKLDQSQPWYVLFIYSVIRIVCPVQITRALIPWGEQLLLAAETGQSTSVQGSIGLKWVSRTKFMVWQKKWTESKCQTPSSVMDRHSLRSLAQCPVCLEVRRDVPIYQVMSSWFQLFHIREYLYKYRLIDVFIYFVYVLFRGWVPSRKR